MGTSKSVGATECPFSAAVPKLVVHAHLQQIVIVNINSISVSRGINEFVIEYGIIIKLFPYRNISSGQDIFSKCLLIVSGQELAVIRESRSYS